MAESVLNGTAVFKVPTPEASTSLPWETAYSMMEKYLDHPRKMYVKDGTQYEILRGHKVSAASLNAVFNLSGSSALASDLLVFYGIRVQDLGETDPSNQFFTLIVCTTDQTGRIITTRVEDFCDPCPPMCGNYLSQLPSDSSI